MTLMLLVSLRLIWTASGASELTGREVKLGLIWTSGRPEMTLFVGMMMISDDRVDLRRSAVLARVMDHESDRQ